MRCGVAAKFAFVVRSRYDLAVDDDDSANRHVVVCECEPSFGQRLVHELDVIHDATLLLMAQIQVASS